MNILSGKVKFETAADEVVISMFQIRVRALGRTVYVLK